MNTDFDVVVVGGGISGMAAAKAVHDSGRTVLVLEANNRFGGRSWSESNPDGVLEHGGMYIGEDHFASIALGESLGMTRTPAPLDGEDVFILNGERMVAVDGELPPGNPHADALAQSFDALERIADQVGWESPWQHPDAAALDAQTVQDWLNETLDDPAAIKMHADLLKPLIGCDATDMSMLFWAYYVSECGGVGPLMATRGGAQNEWWKEGAASVSSRIGAILGANARLDSPVTRIEHSDSGVTVHTSSGAISAQQLILAVPPASANRITFQPPLETSRDQLQMRSPLGRVAKVVLRYPSRFWAKHGLSGVIINYDGMTFYQLDASKEGESMGTVVAFIGGSAYDIWRAIPEDERRSRYLEIASKALGPEALEPVFYEATDWSAQPWNRGAPVTYLPPGVLSVYGPALRASLGRIHIAGTEAALQHAGYMEGGVRAGQAAARAVVAALDAE